MELDFRQWNLKRWVDHPIMAASRTSCVGMVKDLFLLGYQGNTGHGSGPRVEKCTHKSVRWKLRTRQLNVLRNVKVSWLAEASNAWVSYPIVWQVGGIQWWPLFLGSSPLQGRISPVRGQAGFVLNDCTLQLAANTLQEIILNQIPFKHTFLLWIPQHCCLGVLLLMGK